MRAAELFSSPAPHVLPTSSRPTFPKLATLLRRHHRGGSSSIRAAAAAADDSHKRNPKHQLHHASPTPQHRRRRSGGIAPDRTIGKCLEPPWLVPPPPAPENPFQGQQQGDADSLLAAVRIRAASVDGATAGGVPLSQRLVQMKKRIDQKQGQRVGDAVEKEEDGPAGRAVGALMAMFGELQGFVFEGREGLDRVSRDCKDSLAWLFRRVYANSPNLVPLLLLTLSSYIATSTEMTAAAVCTEEPTSSSTTQLDEPVEEADQERAESVAEPQPSPPPPPPPSASAHDFGINPDQLPAMTGFKSWFDLGIKEGALDPWRTTEETPEDRRRRAYERLIAEGDANSLVLSNYAQFLYTVAHDHDRAEHYFQCSIMAEPLDAETLSRYALFLWEERGDVSRAEELFLEAIELDPDNFHHSSSYAWFLWKTGAQDTCFLLSSPTSEQPSPPPHDSITDITL